MFDKFVKTILPLIIISSITIWANGKSEKIDFEKVLVLGPVDSSIPVFGDSEKFFQELLEFESIDVSSWMPSEGEVLQLDKNTNLTWSLKNAGDIEFEEKGNTIYLGAYVRTDRFIEAQLNIESDLLLNVYFDGTSVATKKENTEEISTELKLETGKHFVLLKVINPKMESAGWDIEISLNISEPYSTHDIELSTDPIHSTTIKDLLDNPKIGNVSISSDGKTAAVQISKRTKAKDADEKWFELYNTADGKLVQTFRGGMNINQVDWSPAGNKFAYTTTGKNGSTIWIADLEKNTNNPLLLDIKDLSGFTWSPEGSFLVFTVTEKSEKRDEILFKYEKVEDRWPYANDVNKLFKVDLPEGKVTQLTAGDVSCNLVDISADGSKIIFTQIEYGVKERPYHNIKDFILDLESMRYELILEDNFLGDVKFSPEGNKLIVLGGSSLFNNLGVNVPEGVVPSDFDTQAYIYDIASKTAEPISKEFDPEIASAYWTDKNTIYFATTDKSFKHLYKYNVPAKTYELINLGSEVLHSISFSKNMNAVFTASSSNVPKKVYTINLKTKTVNLLAFPEREEYSKIKLGEVKDWDFISEAGRTVQGRVYYPPYFDKSKTYPAIVYYYGGTSPVERNFEGRYPFNIYAANGYIVYVLQPTGANGYGQTKSAVNVNDWGKVTAAEVIEGSKKFLKAHKFVNPEKIGCMGASYGGFLTLNLITKTDIFSAAISHAGISTLTSYWGEGYWGMWFNSVAAAESFPWNNKDVYVDHSPIYNADKITTPLLLLHGNSDTNVPLGESWTMYTALKLLGNDVELIEIDGLGHHIMQYEKRSKWAKTILAYFDKYLKNQPEWINSLY